MIIAFTGAGVSKASGIPTFDEMGDLREKLDRSFCKKHPEEYREIIAGLQNACDKAVPNDAHLALAEFDVPVMTMNVDSLHSRAGSKGVLELHGHLPDIVLYGDQAPKYQDAHDWLWTLESGDVFLIVGTSYYTTISTMLKYSAMNRGAKVVEINSSAETEVRKFLKENRDKIESFETLQKKLQKKLQDYYVGDSF